MEELEYGKLATDQKKVVDRCLRCVPRTLSEIEKVTTSTLKAFQSGRIETTTIVQFANEFKPGEIKKVNDWWG